MRNLSDTEAYSLYDHCFAGAVRTVSHLVSIRNMTKPFWERWRASEIEDRHLFGFLDSIRSFDDWPMAAQRLVDSGPIRDTILSDAAWIAELRRHSYLCNLAQWGILPLNDQKRMAYRGCRDAYIEAERLAFGSQYRRLPFYHGGRMFFANVHLPKTGADTAPVALVVHGIDGCKEEHLATELALAENGLVAVGFDGPGQAEALLLSGLKWTADFPQVISALLDALAAAGSGDTRRAGLLGISFGGLWSYQCASQDGRIRAIYDLAAPVNAEGFARIPFLLKTKICQVSGARTEAALQRVFALNRVDTPELVSGVSGAVRMVHGGRDRVVPIELKARFRDILERTGRVQVSWQEYPDGDHACTWHFPEIRRDVCRFLSDSLSADA
jgi:dienelactone hydrolase